MKHEDRGYNGINNRRIKAIETSYKGYRFRSRLEARWAVFFDNLDINWEYELEGFEFDGIRYLPDFYLPDLGIWCEIKGKLNWKKHTVDNFFGSKTSFTWHTSEELEKSKSFRDHGNAICVIIGTPGKENIHFFAYDISKSGSSAGPFDGNNCRWIMSKDGKAILQVNDGWPKNFFSNLDFTNELPMLTELEDESTFYKIQNALEVAKSARFEFNDAVR